MHTMKQIVILALHAACMKPLNCFEASLALIFDETQKSNDALTYGEVLATLKELVEEGFITKVFDGTNYCYSYKSCDSLECCEPACHRSEINPEEILCDICKEIEDDTL